MSIKTFYSELKKGFKSPAYLLYSEDAYILKEAVIAAKHSMPEADWDFKFHQYDFESSENALPPEKILDVLNSIPFMGGTQIVVVEGMHKLKVEGIEVFERYLASPSPDSILLMTHKGKLKPHVKKRLAAAKDIPMALSERDLPQWLEERASSKGIEVTREAMVYLIGAIGPEPGLLASEIEKFAMLGLSKLGQKDIEDIVKDSGEYVVFDLINALKKKNAASAMKIYRSLSETQEPYSMLGALNWHYEQTIKEPARKAVVFELLSEADFMIKSSGGAYPLEHLIIKLLRL